MKKISKVLVIAAIGVMVAALGIFGCSSSSSSSNASASASSAASANAYGLNNDGVIVFATVPDWAPFEYAEGTAEPEGFDIALAQAVAEKIGLKAEFKSYGDFDAIFPAVQTATEVDAAISGITILSEREELVAFSDYYYTDDLAIAAMKDAALTDDALNNADITIAVQRGTTGDEHVKENYPDANCMELSNSTDCFAAMQAGQAQAVCTNKAVVESMISGTYTDAEIIKPIATNENFAIAVNKDNTELLEAINGALAELKADGTVDKLMEQYL